MMCGFNIAGWKCIKPYTHEIHTYIKMHNTRYPLRFLFHLHLFTIDILCRMCQDEYDIFYKNIKPFFQFLYTSSLFFVHFNDVLPCTQLMGWQNLKIKTTHLGIKYGEHLVWESIIHKNLTDNICIMDSCYMICTLWEQIYQNF